MSGPSSVRQASLHKHRYERSLKDVLWQKHQLRWTLVKNVFSQLLIGNILHSSFSHLRVIYLLCGQRIWQDDLLTLTSVSSSTGGSAVSSLLSPALREEYNFYFHPAVIPPSPLFLQAFYCRCLCNVLVCLLSFFLTIFSSTTCICSLTRLSTPHVRGQKKKKGRALLCLHG